MTKLSKRFLNHVNNRYLCKLDSGRIVSYDACATIHTDPYNNQFKYIGDGVVYEIFRVRQPGNTRMSFFQLKGRVSK